MCLEEAKAYVRMNMEYIAAYSAALHRRGTATAAGSVWFIGRAAFIAACVCLAHVRRARDTGLATRPCRRVTHCGLQETAGGGVRLKALNVPVAGWHYHLPLKNIYSGLLLLLLHPGEKRKTTSREKKWKEGGNKRVQH